MNTNGIIKNLRKDYGLLSAHERFSAALAAADRGDRSELQALADSCPRTHWRRFWRRVEATDLIGNELLFEIQARVCGHLATGDVELLKTAAAVWAGFLAFCGDIGVDSTQFLSLTAYGSSKAARAGNRPPLVAVALFDATIELLELSPADDSAIEHHREIFNQTWRESVGDSPGLESNQFFN